LLARDPYAHGSISSEDEDVIAASEAITGRMDGLFAPVPCDQWDEVARQAYAMTLERFPLLLSTLTEALPTTVLARVLFGPGAAATSVAIPRAASGDLGADVRILSDVVRGMQLWSSCQTFAEPRERPPGGLLRRVMEAEGATLRPLRDRWLVLLSVFSVLHPRRSSHFTNRVRYLILVQVMKRLLDARTDAAFVAEVEAMGGRIKDKLRATFSRLRAGNQDDPEARRAAAAAAKAQTDRTRRDLDDLEQFKRLFV
jgi:hypothetical protein